MDREEILRTAEKLLRQGRLDAAIAQYASVVEHHPRDWTTANLLGDLFVRAGQVDRAVAQYSRIAEHLAGDGFLSKAAALYKKIIKIRPDDDHAALRAAELSSQLGLGGDARSLLHDVFQQRLRRADRSGARQAALKMAALDAANVVGRLDAARMFADLGDAHTASEHLRAAGQWLLHQGRAAEAERAWREALRFDPGETQTRHLLVQALLDRMDHDGAREIAQSPDDVRAVAEALLKAGDEAQGLRLLEQALALEPANRESRIQMAMVCVTRRRYDRARTLLDPMAADGESRVPVLLAEIDFCTGRLEEGCRAVRSMLSADADQAETIVELTCRIGAANPEAGYAALSSLLDWADASGEGAVALEAVERFVSVVPTCEPALERWVQIGSDGHFEDSLYRAQMSLADAYLHAERWNDARTLGEELVRKRPDDRRNSERLLVALRGLRVPSAEAVVAAHLQRVSAPGEAADLARWLALRRDATGGVEVESSDPAPGATPQPPIVPIRFAADRPPLAVDRLSGDVVSATSILDAGVAGVDVERMLQGAVGTGGKHGLADQVLELDLSRALDELLGPVSPEDTADGAPSEPTAEVPAAPAAIASLTAQDGHVDLSEYLGQLRADAGRNRDEAEAARAYDLAGIAYNQDDRDGAVRHLREAFREPSLRFRAASMLARIAKEHGRASEAVEWLERAAEVPPPSPQAGHALLYELGDMLETLGEEARALAVFLELSFSDPDFADVGARVGRLKACQPGVQAPARMPPESA
jgi:tetratricopeptide (TPR) repeat protein